METPNDNKDTSGQLPTEQTGWNFAFPDLRLVSTEEAVEDSKKKIKEAEELMEQDQYHEAADLLSEAAEATYVVL